MRLICPNCDAQYEVPTEVIPEGGRDVQCSNCGHTWFQQHPDDQDGMLALGAEDRLDDEDEFGSEEPAAAPRPKPRELDPGVADVLREEAALEARARVADALESQPDLGLAEPAPDDQAEARRRGVASSDRQKGRVLHEDPPEDLVDANAEEAVAVASAGSRSSRLPDVEEINSTLRNKAEPRKVTSKDGSAEFTHRSGAFGRGFRWAISLVIFAVLLYMFAPQIGTAIPETESLLKRYVTQVDKGRVWLDGQVDKGLLWLDGMSSETRQSSDG